LAFESAQAALQGAALANRPKEAAARSALFSFDIFTFMLAFNPMRGL
jgi:hypothetical protein